MNTETALHVPGASIACMAVALLVAFALPVGLCAWLRIRKKADLPPFFIGCAVMVLFAFVLERAVHGLVLGSPAGVSIQNNVWLYSLYGGFMAGLFEETGRFAAFKTVLRRYRERDVNALMYGAGHGGLEAVVILGITSVNNLIYSILLNTGRSALLTAPLSGDMLAQVEAAFTSLATFPSWQFLLGAVERIFAVGLHIALSVPVWFAAKKKGCGLLYPLAVLLHALVDAVTVMLSRSGVSVLIVEGSVGVLTVLTALIAAVVWRRNAAVSEDGQAAS